MPVGYIRAPGLLYAAGCLAAVATIIYDKQIKWYYCFVLNHSGTSDALQMRESYCTPFPFK